MAECRCFLDGDGVCTSCGQRRVHAVTADVSDWHGALAHISQHGFDVDAVLRDAALNVAHWKANQSDVNAPITEMNVEPPVDADALMDAWFLAQEASDKCVTLRDGMCQTHQRHRHDCDAELVSARAALKARIQPAPAQPLSIRLHCPVCHVLHVDRGEFATKPHHTHACQVCGNTWRPAVAPTVGVEFLPGFKDNVPTSPPVPPVAPPENPDTRMFPIMDGMSIPWPMIAPHEQQAKKNHDQTLERLAERGGLSVMEAYAVLTDVHWREVKGIPDIRQRFTEFVDKDVRAENARLRATLTRPKVTAEALAPEVMEHLDGPRIGRDEIERALRAALRVLEKP